MTSPPRAPLRGTHLGLGTALVLVTTALFALSPTTALAKCAPGRPNSATVNWDGWKIAVSAPTGGVYANILNYSPWVYNAPGSVAVGWSMLVDTTDTGGSSYGQVGWYEQPGGARKTFAQWRECSTCTLITQFAAAYPTNQYTEYKVLWNNACTSCLSFYAGGTRLWYDWVGYIPNQAQIFGEINNLASQMAGAGQEHEDFSNSHVFQGGWLAFNGMVGDSNFAYYSELYVSSLDFQIWDNACLGT